MVGVRRQHVDDPVFAEIDRPLGSRIRQRNDVAAIGVDRHQPALRAQFGAARPALRINFDDQPVGIFPGKRTNLIAAGADAATGPFDLQPVDDQAAPPP